MINTPALQQLFNQLVARYSPDAFSARALWNEIVSAYTAENRHYHNLHHLENIYLQITAVQHNVRDWDVMLFSLFYHDVVYDVTRNDNEACSADLAVTRLQQLGFPGDRILCCRDQILATKGHVFHADNDINIFTDADLCVLGQPWGVYAVYAQQIRKEYGVFPDDVYIPGRIMVLNHFLKMERIFKTGNFFNSWEAAARENLLRELEELGTKY